jgi:alpha/beta superfamily hydrolase
MIAFEVFINGKKTATAGVGELGVLSAILSWVRRQDESSDELTFELGGLITTGEQKEHLRWLSEQLSVGDQVLVRIVDSDVIDSPKEREVTSSERDEFLERKYYERLKEKYEK